MTDKQKLSGVKEYNIPKEDIERLKSIQQSIATKYNKLGYIIRQSMLEKNSVNEAISLDEKMFNNTLLDIGNKLGVKGGIIGVDTVNGIIQAKES